MEFGIFYIPPQNDLYRIGSSILGYDIRNQTKIPLHKNIDASWVKNISPYGFHITITDAVIIEENQLAPLVKNFKDILLCFPSNAQFNLKVENPAFAFWEFNPSQAAIRYASNTLLNMLHTALVTKLQSQGKGSYYHTLLQNNSIPDNWSADKIEKVKQFYSPYIFDEFKPHFSLLNPYTGEEKENVLSQLSSNFRSIENISVESLCFVIRNNAHEEFSIYEEVTL